MTKSYLRFLLKGCIHLTFLMAFYQKIQNKTKTNKKNNTTAHFWCKLVKLVKHKPCEPQWFIRIYIVAACKVSSPFNRQTSLISLTCSVKAIVKDIKEKHCSSYQNKSCSNQGWKKRSDNYLLLQAQKQTTGIYFHYCHYWWTHF